MSREWRNDSDSKRAPLIWCLLRGCNLPDALNRSPLIHTTLQAVCYFWTFRRQRSVGLNSFLQATELIVNSRPELCDFKIPAPHTADSLSPELASTHPQENGVLDFGECSYSPSSKMETFPKTSVSLTFCSHFALTLLHGGYSPSQRPYQNSASPPRHSSTEVKRWHRYSLKHLTQDSV